jgi:hypothetical protein
MRPLPGITDAGTCLPRDGLDELAAGQLTLDPAALPDRRGPLRTLRHHPSLTPGRRPPR